MSAPSRLINRYRLYRRIGYRPWASLRLSWESRDWLPARRAVSRA